MTRFAVLLLALHPLAAGAQHAGHATPYAGLQDRPLAALSAKEVEGLEAGRGLSYALSAELNGHPGPAHLLELARELQLDKGQVEAITAARAKMTEEAQRLGRQLIEAEHAIEEAFEAGGLDRSRLAALVAEAARIEGELRTAHLAAHLAVTPLLTPDQIAAYDRLRGYAPGAHAPHAHDH